MPDRNDPGSFIPNREDRGPVLVADATDQHQAWFALCARRQLEAIRIFPQRLAVDEVDAMLCLVRFTLLGIELELDDAVIMPGLYRMSTNEVVFLSDSNGPGLTGHGMDGSKLACESPARGPVQPMVRARLRGAIHWVDAVGPGPFTAARKRRRERRAPYPRRRGCR
jgi:hypothetical protein